MELDLLVAGSNKVVDDVRRARISSGAAKPLVARKALDDGAGRVDTAVPKIPKSAPNPNLYIRGRVRQVGESVEPTRMHEEGVSSLPPES